MGDMDMATIITTVTTMATHTTMTIPTLMDMFTNTAMQPPPPQPVGAPCPSRWSPKHK